MIQLRGVNGKEVVEMDEATMCQLIDGLHYVETNEVRFIGAVTPLRELRAFEMVAVDTGFDDDKQPCIMTILPKKKDGWAGLVATLALAATTFGCSGSTYHYSYSCYGQGCAPPPMTMVGYVQPQAVPRAAQVVYVDRPMEVRVHRDGTIQTRRAAQPRKRTQ